VNEAGEMKKQRRSYTYEEKLRMVEATLEPGASVARVAQRNGVNANQLFSWRRQHGRGVLHGSQANRTKLLPVVIAQATASKEIQPAKACGDGVMQVDLPHGHVRIEGQVDIATVRAVLELLLR
jgi:transposase